MQVCTSLQTDNQASNPPLSFLQTGCPSCCPTNSVKALKATTENNQRKIQLKQSKVKYKSCECVCVLVCISHDFISCSQLMGSCCPAQHELLLFVIADCWSEIKSTKIAVCSLTCHNAMGTHMPHGITQCNLPPDRADIPTLTPAEAGTRLSDPGGMQG